MKKNLLIALGAVALLLGSCTKDNNEITDPVSPITGLEMPASSAEKPITEGEVVSINGKGFTASDEIWLSTATKAADEVKAEGFALTETGISFTAPAIDGEVSLTLKQNGKVHLLGKMFFATKTQEPEPTNPITELEIPTTSAEAPMIAGGTVAINGKGFTASDEIWLSTATKAADEVKAEGFALTETGISFTAPAIDSEVSLTLKQNGKVYPLGKMFFSTKSTPQEHFYGVFSGIFMQDKEDGWYEFREYDPSTNTFKPALTIPDDGKKRFVASDNSNLYYLKRIGVSDEGELCRYDVKENTVTSLGKSMAIWETILTLTIDNQLYSLMPNYETMVLSLVPLTGDGKGIAVSTFKLPWGETNEPRITEEVIYNPASKSILLVMDHGESGEDGMITIETLISLSIETGVVTITEHCSTSRNGELNIAVDNKGILLFTVNNSERDTPDYYQKFNVIITRLDPVTLKKQAEVAKFTSDCGFDSSVYLASNNTMLSTGYHWPLATMVSETFNAWSYDLTTKTLKQVNNSDGCILALKMLY